MTALKARPIVAETQLPLDLINNNVMLDNQPKEEEKMPEVGYWEGIFFPWRKRAYENWLLLEEAKKAITDAVTKGRNGSSPKKVCSIVREELKKVASQIKK